MAEGCVDDKGRIRWAEEPDLEELDLQALGPDEDEEDDDEEDDDEDGEGLGEGESDEGDDPDAAVVSRAHGDAIFVDR